MTSVIGETKTLGQKKSIATYLELASFDIEGVERYLYMGCKVVTPFAKIIRKSTWFTTQIKKLCGCGDYCDGYSYDLTPYKNSGMDFLLYTYLKWKTPQINLVNLPNTVPVTTMVGNREENLYFGILENDVTLPSGTIIPAGSTVTGPTVALLDPIFGLTEQTIFELRSEVPQQRVRWTDNLLHNVISCLQLVINGQPVEEQDRVWFDIVSENRLREGTYEAYQKMIGNIDELTQPTNSNIVGPEQQVPEAFIPSVELKLPLPFSFSKSFYTDRGDVGHATTALPLLNLYCNIIQICVKLIENITDLLIFERQDTRIATSIPGTTPPITTVYNITYNDGDLVADLINVQNLGIVQRIPGKFTRISHVPVFTTDKNGKPHKLCDDLRFSDFIDLDHIKLEAPVVYAKVATVTEDERRRHRNSCILRSLLMERVISLTQDNVCPGSSIDVPLNYIGGQTRALFFMAANQTARQFGSWSNYTNNSDQSLIGKDSVQSAGIIYNNTEEKIVMTADHFSEIEPFYHSQRIPSKIGYHSLYWALWLNSLEPDGSVGLDDICNAILRIYTTCSDYQLIRSSNFIPSSCNCIAPLEIDNPNTQQYSIEVRALGWQVYNILNDSISFC